MRGFLWRASRLFLHLFGLHTWRFFGNTQELTVFVCEIPGCLVVKRVKR